MAIAKQRVSQQTIDDIKKMGMAKALRLAGENKSAAQAGAVAEFAEGVRRMYGEKRYNAAGPKKSTSGTYTTGGGVSKPKSSGSYTTGSGVSTPKKAAAPAPKKAVPGPTTQGGRAKYFTTEQPKKAKKKSTTTTGPRTQGGRAKYYQP